MGHGFLGKVLSNPITDIGLALGGVGLLGGFGALGLGGAESGFEAAEYGAGSESAAAAAAGTSSAISTDVMSNPLAAGDWTPATSTDPIISSSNPASAPVLAGGFGGGGGGGTPSAGGGGSGGGGNPASNPSSWFQRTFPNFASQHPTLAAAFQGSKGGLGIAQTLAGLYGVEQSQRLMAATRPPNPASLTSMPGYEAGRVAVERSMAANGYLGSGNMMAALQKYGGDAYMQNWQGNIQGAQAGMGGLEGMMGSGGLAATGLGNLFGG